MDALVPCPIDKGPAAPEKGVFFANDRCNVFRNQWLEVSYE